MVRIEPSVGQRAQINPSMSTEYLRGRGGDNGPSPRPRRGPEIRIRGPPRRIVPSEHWPAIVPRLKEGALMSYGFDLTRGARRLAAQIVEILNGGKPAQMPFFQETYFALVINLKTARELAIARLRNTSITIAR